MLLHLILSHKEVYRSRWLMILLIRYMLIRYMLIRYKRQLYDTYDMAQHRSLNLPHCMSTMIEKLSGVFCYCV
jgi:hypothetical protein